MSKKISAWLLVCWSLLICIGHIVTLSDLSMILILCTIYISEILESEKNTELTK